MLSISRLIGRPFSSFFSFHFRLACAVFMCLCTHGYCLFFNDDQRFFRVCYQTLLYLLIVLILLNTFFKYTYYILLYVEAVSVIDKNTHLTVRNI